MEQQIIDTIKTLPTNAHQELLLFVEFLAHKYDDEETKSKDDDVERDKNGWPIDFFEEIAGSWVGEPLVRPPQGKLQERDPLL